MRLRRRSALVFPALHLRPSAAPAPQPAHDHVSGSAPAPQPAHDHVSGSAPAPRSRLANRAGRPVWKSDRASSPPASVTA